MDCFRSELKAQLKKLNLLDKILIAGLVFCFTSILFEPSSYVGVVLVSVWAAVKVIQVLFYMLPSRVKNLFRNVNAFNSEVEGERDREHEHAAKLTGRVNKDHGPVSKYLGEIAFQWAGIFFVGIVLSFSGLSFLSVSEKFYGPFIISGLALAALAFVVTLLLLFFSFLAGIINYFVNIFKDLVNAENADVSLKRNRFKKKAPRVDHRIASRLQRTTVKPLRDIGWDLMKDPLWGTLYLTKYREHGHGSWYELTALSEEEARHALRSPHSLEMFYRTSPERWILNDGKPSEYTLRTRRYWWKDLLKWLHLRKPLSEARKNVLYRFHLNPTPKYSREHGLELRTDPENGTVYLIEVVGSGAELPYRFTPLSPSDAQHALNNENSLEDYAKYGRWQLLLG